jgi:hypothetical protein
MTGLLVSSAALAQELAGEPGPVLLDGVPVALKKFPTDIPLTCDNDGFTDSR